MRHPFHSICPYFAMFPETFVERQVHAYTSLGDTTFDPFCGRGTTVFQSLLMGRQSAGTDVNPVAACISGAKASPPALEQLLNRLSELEATFERGDSTADELPPFFSACFSPTTLVQVCFLRQQLDWRANDVDRFLAAMALGALHGESHRSKLYFSNRMPRTISTKPEYSIRWWAEKGCVAPDRDVFAILRQLARFRYQAPAAELIGRVRQADARQASEVHSELKGTVKLVVTSPPYLDTTDYSEDQWLRLWFLGGNPKPETRLGKDDRLTKADAYWQFLTEAWAGMADLLMEDAVIVVRIGGRGLSREDLFSGLTVSLGQAFSGSKVKAFHEGITSSIKPRETTAFRPNSGSKDRVEHDFAFELSAA